MKALPSFEKLVTFYQSTRHNISEDSNLQQYRCENLKSGNNVNLWLLSQEVTAWPKTIDPRLTPSSIAQQRRLGMPLTEVLACRTYVINGNDSSLLLLYHYLLCIR